MVNDCWKLLSLHQTIYYKLQRQRKLITTENEEKYAFIIFNWNAYTRCAHCELLSLYHAIYVVAHGLQADYVFEG